MVDQKKLRAEKKASGICYDCQDQAVEGRVRCQKHLDIRNRNQGTYQKVLYNRLKKAGLCVHCGTEKAEAGRVSCFACLLSYSSFSLSHYHDLSEPEWHDLRKKQNQRYHSLKAKGICTQCGKNPIVKDSAYLCKECRKKKNK